MYRVEQVPQWRLVFGDEKSLKGADLFNRSGRADPLTGLVEDFVIDSDWRNTYAITGAVFSDFVMQNLQSGFLQPGDFLVLDNASIHHFQEAMGLDAYLWNYHGIFLQFLPTRSPELNPIELLWNILTQRLLHFPLGDEYGPRSHRVAHAARMLMDAFSHEDVIACFRKCGYI